MIAATPKKKLEETCAYGFALSTTSGVDLDGVEGCAQ